MGGAMDQAAWLAQVNEPVIEPDLPICDPHHHLWDHPNSRYLLDELLLDTAPATTSSRPCSSNARRCIAPTDPTR